MMYTLLGTRIQCLMLSPSFRTLRSWWSVVHGGRPIILLLLHPQGRKGWSHRVGVEGMIEGCYGEKAVPSG